MKLQFFSFVSFRSLPPYLSPSNSADSADEFNHIRNDSTNPLWRFGHPQFICIFDGFNGQNSLSLESVERATTEGGLRA